MELAEKKRLIVNKIAGIQEEWLIRAIEKLLDIEDNDDSSDWQLPLLKERLAHYKANPHDVVKWGDIKKRLKDEL